MNENLPFILETQVRAKSNMAANLRQIFAHSSFSRQFFKYFLYKYVENRSSMAGRRLFSIIAMRYRSLLGQNPSLNASNLIEKSRYFNSGCQRASSVHSNGLDDPEFVTEQVSFPGENVKDIGNMMKSIREKTGVIMKAIGGNEKIGGKGCKILIGGARSEVKQAVFYLKSLVDQDVSNQRLILLQDDKIDQQITTKEKPIWSYYRRNFKGQKPPMKTRKKCIRGKAESLIVSGNPCPVCRLYLAGGYQLDHKDVDLLLQFISPHTGEVFEASKTGVCRFQQENLIKAIQTAKDYGLLRYSAPGPRSIAKPAQRAEIPTNVRLK